jgi:Flp pilus assembly protein TadG
MLQNLLKLFRHRAKGVSRFRDSEQGATAVEFALIAPAFLACIIAIIETTLFLFAQAALQNAAMETARVFMTGSAQSNNTTESQLVTNTICPLIKALFNCNNLIVAVQNYSSFASASTAAPTLYTNGQLNSNWSYSPGTPGDVMVVQLIYQWPVVGGPLGFSLSNLPGSAIEMMGVTAFRVEPYGSGNSTSSSGTTGSGSSGSGSSGSGTSGSGSSGSGTSGSGSSGSGSSGSGSSGSGGSGSSGGGGGWACWLFGWGC